MVRDKLKCLSLIFLSQKLLRVALSKDRHCERSAAIANSAEAFA